MVSRVRSRGGLRVLQRPSKRKGGLSHLLQLKHSVALAAWNAGYDTVGDWDPHREPPAPQTAPQRGRKRCRVKG